MASALTAETGFEIMKCVADVDMPARVRMGSKREIFMFFNSGYAHDRNLSNFWTSCRGGSRICERGADHGERAEPITGVW